MIPQRLRIILLASLVLAFVTLPSVLAQRRQQRVFTNEDFPNAAPPPATAPAASANAAAAPAAGTPAAEPASAAPDAAPAGGATADESFPAGIDLAEHLQKLLRQYHEELSGDLEAEVDVTRQERLRTLMNLATQIIVYNQLHIADLQAQQKQKEAEAQAQAGVQPAP